MSNDNICGIMYHSPTPPPTVMTPDITADVGLMYLNKILKSSEPPTPIGERLSVVLTGTYGEGHSSEL